MKHFALFVVALALLFPIAMQAETDAETALCPVCRVHDGETEAEKVVASAEHDGQTYGFCSVGCRDKFVKDPVVYLPPVLPRPAPSFEVHDLDGNKVSSEAFRGRVVLLDFWATWCPPCVKDLPRLSELHARYADRGVSVVGLSIDEGDRAVRKVSRMVKKKEASHPIYMDSTQSPAWETYQVRAVPNQFLIDAEGNIVAQWSGKIDLDVVEAAIVELLGDGEE